MRLEGEKLGHYQLTRFIQGGGMGEVYLAQDLTLSRQVAIKVMKTETVLYPDAQSSKDAARLFQREMQAISMLDHPHILTLHEAGKQQIGHDNIAYMVMPYCPEGSLADWIRRYRSTQPLSPDEVAQILQQAADALQYAHDQKILHLDIKPANFLVRRQTEPSQLPNLLLADFGVAKIATTSKLSGAVRGTLEYMAPEQVEGAPVAASDQYALGIMVYELLTGRTPYQGALPHVVPYMRNKINPEPPSTVNPSLPSALDKVVLQALAKKPQDRFASVKEFASAFAAVLKPSTKQSYQMQQPSFQPKPTDTQDSEPLEDDLKKQLIALYSAVDYYPPHPSNYQSTGAEPPKQQQISLQRQGYLSPEAYQFATTYPLGTPLEEFRVGYKIIHILIGIVFLIISTGGTALEVLLANKAIIYVSALLVIGLLSIILSLISGLDSENTASVAITSILLASIAGGIMAGITESLVLLPALVALVVGVVAGVWLLLYPKFYRSWHVYLYSDGFVYTHGKKVDVFLWNQIRKTEKTERPLRYIIIRRDSKKIVLGSKFQSIEYLGDYIIREYERLNRS